MLSFLKRRLIKGCNAAFLHHWESCDECRSSEKESVDDGKHDFGNKVETERQKNVCARQKKGTWSTGVK